MNRKRTILIITLILILLLSIILGVSVGPVKINIFGLQDARDIDIFYLRLMRVILALVAGSGLAVCGVILQGILRNPLAEPYVLGISSAAALGAVSSIMVGINLAFQPLISFIFAITALVIVYNLAKSNKIISIHSLLLCGVIVGMLVSSITMFLITISPNEAIHGIMWWLLGNLQIFNIKLLVIVSCVVIAGVSLSLLFARDLNAISLGEEEAMHLGVDVEKLKRILFVLSSLMTAALVSTCGMIGFVGLISPHMVRLIIGSDHKILLPLAAITGGIFLVLADIGSRILMSPYEIPIGVITALLGAPIFIILFKRKI